MKFLAITLIAHAVTTLSLLDSANVTNPIGPYAELVRYYREQWARYGHEQFAEAAFAGSPT
jgi:hypothetical protein